MDFVISDVATVDQEEDDEPLFEISKVVTVVNEKRPYESLQERGDEVRKPTKYTKICYVPLCPNTTKSTPEKMFITIPVNPARRKAWLDAVGKSSIGRNPKSPMFCCQDHFNLKTDMKNYQDYIRRGRVQMLLHQTVVPHLFICNNYGHLKRNERIEVLRKLHEERDSILYKQEEQDDDEQEEVTTITRLTPRQRSMEAAKKQKIDNDDDEYVVPNKTVFIEMPAFEYDDHPEFVEVKEDGVDTIVIDDSD